MAKLVQIAHAIFVSPLGRNGRIIWLNWRASARRVISCIKIVVNAAATAATGVGIAVAATIIISATDSGAGAPDGTARRLAALLSALALLPLALLCLASALLASLSIAGERIHLIAQALDAIQCGF